MLYSVLIQRVFDIFSLRLASTYVSLANWQMPGLLRIHYLPNLPKIGLVFDGSLQVICFI